MRVPEWTDRLWRVNGAARQGADWLLVRYRCGPEQYPGDAAIAAVPAPERPPARTPGQADGWPSPTTLENHRLGVPGFTLTGPRFAGDHRHSTGQIEAYAAATSVEPGQGLAFHVSLAPAQTYRVEVFRIGHYAGAGARSMTLSPWLDGTTQPPPERDQATGALVCRWRPDWTLEVGEDWTSGCYLALLTNAAGYRAWVPFTVRQPGRAADLLFVVPTSTYQARNVWPRRQGTEQPDGFALTTSDAAPGWRYGPRAEAVSHDRPFHGSGLPYLADRDLALASWLEAAGQDVAYATSEDLHAGRVDPGRYRAVVLPGQDEYWSGPTRRWLAAARNSGTSLLVFGARAGYWRVRYPAGERVVRCCQDRSDPGRWRHGSTGPWRATRHPEQGLLGLQHVSAVREPAPLVVTGGDHWLWAGTGAAEGDELPGVVAGEADQQFGDCPLPFHWDRALLAASPFEGPGPATLVQHTQVYQAESGAWVFTAGTAGWTAALTGGGPAAPVLDQATRNLLDRVRNRVFVPPNAIPRQARPWAWRR